MISPQPMPYQCTLVYKNFVLECRQVGQAWWLRVPKGLHRVFLFATGKHRRWGVYMSCNNDGNKGGSNMGACNKTRMTATTTTTATTRTITTTKLTYEERKRQVHSLSGMVMSTTNLGSWQAVYDLWGNSLFGHFVCTK